MRVARLDCLAIGTRIDSRWDKEQHIKTLVGEDFYSKKITFVLSTTPS